MTERRSASGRKVRPMAMDDDMRALGDATARDLPSLAQVVAVVRSRSSVSRRASAPFAPSLVRLFVVATIAVGVLMLLAPVSYERTVGYDVALNVAAADGEPRVDLAALPWPSVLGASDVSTTARSNEVQLHAYVPAAKVRDPAARVRALARALTERGYAVRTSVVPRRERVSGSLYAYARDQWFRVNPEGKTSAEIESELRRKLDEAGLAKTTLLVDGNDHERKVLIQPHEDGTTAPGGSIGLEIGAGKPAASGVSVVTSRIATVHDGIVLRAEVTARGRKASVEVPHVESLSDMALAAEVQSRLVRAGLRVRVRVNGGTLQVEAR